MRNAFAHKTIQPIFSFEGASCFSVTSRNISLFFPAHEAHSLLVFERESASSAMGRNENAGKAETEPQK